jgi:hypothetical protein
MWKLSAGRLASRILRVHCGPTLAIEENLDGGNDGAPRMAGWSLHNRNLARPAGDVVFRIVETGSGKASKKIMADLFRALVQIVVGGLRVFNLVGNIDLVGFELGRHNGLLTYALFTLDPVDVRAVNRIFHFGRAKPTVLSCTRSYIQPLHRASIPRRHASKQGQSMKAPCS